MNDPGDNASRPSTSHAQEEGRDAAALGMTAPNGPEPPSDQKEAQDLGRIQNGVTDIPAVAAYAQRIGAKLRSMRKLAVIERRGRYPVTVAEIRFGADGVITAPDDYGPNEAEADAIAKAWKRYTWPGYKPFPWAGKDAPAADPRIAWSMADPSHVAVCWDRERRHILCVEERRPRDDGGKDFYIWTHWTHGDGGQWLVAEPPEGLFLFGLETIQNAATIYVHEGAKAAKAMQALVADDGEAGWRSHPWGRDLRGQSAGAVAHVGWLGGALRPEATDWSPLAQPGARLIFVADNDRDGIEAVSRISRARRLKMEAVLFNDDWPDGFDLADKLPAARVTAGTRIADLLVPATWLTERERSEEREPGRPKFRFRREAIGDWRYTIKPALFFHSARPGAGFTEAELDAKVRPFSDAELTARLIRRHRSAQADGVAYLPGSNALIERDGKRLVNQWTPSRVQPRAGSAWPLGRLLVHCFPDRADRRHCVRWGATLAARPDVRMLYAILLRSETQGVGKTTLANILAELVGAENVARPNEVALTEGSFNSFIARKRLIIVDELYSGHSRKTYNRLKAPITDPKLRVNEKYQPEYEIDNFAHFIFSSNDLVPIFIDANDRRFFMPRVAETKLPPAFWTRFHKWLSGGGLEIIMRCAWEFVAKHVGVGPNEDAPMSAAKAAIIENSISDEMRSVREAARDLVERGAGDAGQHIAVTLEEFQRWHCELCRDRGWKRLTGNRLAEELRRAGMLVRGRHGQTGRDERVKIGGRKVPVASNFDPGSGAEAADAIRSALKTMNDLGEEMPL